METIGSFDAKTRLSELLKRVGRGESFQITRHGHPIARLVPEIRPDPDRLARIAERLKRFHENMPEVPLKELLDARHEGHHY
jgi:prevent-host-death family protein